MPPVLRALLFMPGDDRRKIEKGAALDVDAVIMDIEDGVALNQKPAARETIRAALTEVDFGRTARLVNRNGKLNGEITPTTPWGSRRARLVTPSRLGSTRPLGWVSMAAAS